MAFEMNDLIRVLFLVLLKIISITSTNIDCNGKAFHCVDLTHFMICVDLGAGVSMTIDDFIIPCPQATECDENNHFECEYPRMTTTGRPLEVIDVTKQAEIRSGIDGTKKTTAGLLDHVKPLSTTKVTTEVTPPSNIENLASAIKGTVFSVESALKQITNIPNTTSEANEIGVKVKREFMVSPTVNVLNVESTIVTPLGESESTTVKKEQSNDNSSIANIYNNSITYATNYTEGYTPLTSKISNHGSIINKNKPRDQVHSQKLQQDYNESNLPKNINDTYVTEEVQTATLISRKFTVNSSEVNHEPSVSSTTDSTKILLDTSSDMLATDNPIIEQKFIRKNGTEKMLTDKFVTTTETSDIIHVLSTNQEQAISKEVAYNLLQNLTGEHVGQNNDNSLHTEVNLTTTEQPLFLIIHNKTTTQTNGTTREDSAKMTTERWTSNSLESIIDSNHTGRIREMFTTITHTTKPSPEQKLVPTTTNPFTNFFSTPIQEIIFPTGSSVQDISTSKNLNVSSETQYEKNLHKTFTPSTTERLLNAEINNVTTVDKITTEPIQLKISTETYILTPSVFQNRRNSNESSMSTMPPTTMPSETIDNTLITGYQDATMLTTKEIYSEKMLSPEILTETSFADLSLSMKATLVQDNYVDLNEITKPATQPNKDRFNNNYNKPTKESILLGITNEPAANGPTTEQFLTTIATKVILHPDTTQNIYKQELSSTTVPTKFFSQTLITEYPDVNIILQDEAVPISEGILSLSGFTTDSSAKEDIQVPNIMTHENTYDTIKKKNVTQNDTAKFNPIQITRNRETTELTMTDKNNTKTTPVDEFLGTTEETITHHLLITDKDNVFIKDANIQNESWITNEMTNNATIVPKQTSSSATITNLEPEATTAVVELIPQVIEPEIHNKQYVNTKVIGEITTTDASSNQNNRPLTKIMYIKDLNADNVQLKDSTDEANHLDLDILIFQNNKHASFPITQDSLVNKITTAQRLLKNMSTINDTHEVLDNKQMLSSSITTPKDANMSTIKQELHDFNHSKVISEEIKDSMAFADGVVLPMEASVIKNINNNSISQIHNHSDLNHLNKSNLGNEQRNVNFTRTVSRNSTRTLPKTIISGFHKTQNVTNIDQPIDLTAIPIESTITLLSSGNLTNNNSDNSSLTNRLKQTDETSTETIRNYLIKEQIHSQPSEKNVAAVIRGNQEDLINEVNQTIKQNSLPPPISKETAIIEIGINETGATTLFSESTDRYYSSYYITKDMTVYDEIVNNSITLTGTKFMTETTIPTLSTDNDEKNLITTTVVPITENNLLAEQKDMSTVLTASYSIGNKDEGMIFQKELQQDNKVMNATSLATKDTIGNGIKPSFINKSQIISKAEENNATNIKNNNQITFSTMSSNILSETSTTVVMTEYKGNLLSEFATTTESTFTNSFIKYNTDTPNNIADTGRRYHELTQNNEEFYTLSPSYKTTANDLLTMEGNILLPTGWTTVSPVTEPREPQSEIPTKELVITLKTPYILKSDVISVLSNIKEDKKFMPSLPSKSITNEISKKMSTDDDDALFTVREKSTLSTLSDGTGTHNSTISSNSEFTTNAGKLTETNDNIVNLSTPVLRTTNSFNRIRIDNNTSNATKDSSVTTQIPYSSTLISPYLDSNSSSLLIWSKIFTTSAKNENSSEINAESTLKVEKVTARNPMDYVITETNIASHLNAIPTTFSNTNISFNITPSALVAEVSTDNKTTNNYIYSGNSSISVHVPVSHNQGIMKESSEMKSEQKNTSLNSNVTDKTIVDIKITHTNLSTNRFTPAVTWNNLPIQENFRKSTKYVTDDIGSEIPKKIQETENIQVKKFSNMNYLGMTTIMSFLNNTNLVEKSNAPEILDQGNLIRQNGTIKNNISQVQNNERLNYTMNTLKPKVNNIVVNRLNMSSINTLNSGFNCLTRSRGRHADDKDCRKFYICIGRPQPMLGICPPNTVFSHINKQCTRNVSHCVRNNQFRCSIEGRFSDFFTDNVYYICVKNKLHFTRYKLQCQSEYYLNKETIRCEPNLDTSSVSSSSISENSQNSNDDSALNTQGINSNVNFECEKEGKFPYLGDCTKYILCDKSNSSSEYRRKIKKCSSDEVFDSGKKKCVESKSHHC